MTAYYLTFDAHEYVTVPPSAAYEAGEPWSDYGSTAVSVYPRTLHRTPPRAPHEAIDPDRRYGGLTSLPLDDVPPGQTAYVVIATYTDGDTFGSSGYWCVAAVCSTPEAAKAAEERCAIPEPQKIGGPDWMPWHGYFSSLDETQTYPMVVLA